MLHANPDRAAPFPVDDHGRVPLSWFADVSVDPDGVLALYNESCPLLPADSASRVWLSQEEAWDFWEELITRRLAKLPVPRFEEPPEEPAATHPDDSKWVTFDWD